MLLDQILPLPQVVGLVLWPIEKLSNDAFIRLPHLRLRRKLSMRFLPQSVLLTHFLKFEAAEESVFSFLRFLKLYILLHFLSFFELFLPCFTHVLFARNRFFVQFRFKVRLFAQIEGSALLSIILFFLSLHFIVLNIKPKLLPVLFFLLFSNGLIMVNLLL